MGGWNITVYRQPDGGASPAPADLIKGKPLAAWTAHIAGLRWLEELVKEGKAINLGGNFYPSHYTATAEEIIPRIVELPPEARTDWRRDLAEAAFGDWSYEKAGIDRSSISACSPGEWLLLEVWDRS